MFLGVTLLLECSSCKIYGRLSRLMIILNKKQTIIWFLIVITRTLALPMSPFCSSWRLVQIWCFCQSELLVAFICFEAVIRYTIFVNGHLSILLSEAYLFIRGLHIHRFSWLPECKRSPVYSQGFTLFSKVEVFDLKHLCIFDLFDCIK